MRPLAERGTGWERIHGRRAQMQIGEMVLVLIVAFVIALGAIVFFTQRAHANGIRDALEQQQLDLAVTAKYVASMSGLRVSIDNTEAVTEIDWERARQFSVEIASPLHRSVYAERLAGYSAKLTPVYPPEADYRNLPPPANEPPFSELVLFDFTNAVAASRNSVPFVIPVLLSDPRSGKKAYALLTVTQVSP